MKKRKNTYKPGFWLIAFLVIILSILFRMFVFEIYLIPSQSMASALLPGDVILVNKLSYGPRIFVNENDSKRLPAFGNIELDDVLVFNFPEGDSIYSNRPEINFYQSVGFNGRSKTLKDTVFFGNLTNLPVKYRQPYIKRCLALPGQELVLHKGDILYNNDFAYDSIIRTRDKRFNFSLANNYRWIFPHVYKWNKNNLGPLKIPAKGAIIDLNSSNLPLYERIISIYENNKLVLKDDAIWINDTLTEHYTFKQDYYFMMGDNREYSIDSRFWGFLPEDHIIGKASLVLFSLDSEAEGFWQCIRWNRIFKPIK
ncbi:MAG: signal peptidase I [Cyclobacteriaceae bacterium]